MDVFENLEKPLQTIINKYNKTYMKQQPTFEKFITDLENEFGKLDAEQCLGAAALYEAWFDGPKDPFNEKLYIED